MASLKLMIRTSRRPGSARICSRSIGSLAGVGLLALLAPGWFLIHSEPQIPSGGKAALGNDGLAASMPVVFRKGVPGSIDDLRAMEKRVELVVERVSPAVVGVVVGEGAGSGVVVSADGWVMCAAHVCDQPGLNAHFLFPDGRKAIGKTCGLDHDTDCGLMKITDPGPWPHAELGNPSMTKVGDWVLALGHPGGFDPERPVVARLGRIIRSSPWLQTDCTLIGGDSGGPLFDMRGQVVGIHSRISDSTVENFHVPAKAFVESWARLAKGDEWGGRPTIGVNGVDFPKGCRLERVPEDGPAYKAGLRVGDIILRVQDEPVIDAACLTQCIGQTKPGDEITLLIDRAGTEFPVNVKVGVRHRTAGRGWRGR